MEEDDDGEDEDEEKQIRILQETTGMPREAFDGGKKKKQPLELPLQPGDGDGPVTIHDLLDNIQGKPGYSKLRKRLQQQEKKPMVVQPPLPKVEREKLERGVVYQQSRKEVTKWEPLVKRNREAPTLYFENDVNLGVNTVGAIASEFKPRTEFEKKMAEIIYSAEMIEAHKNDGAKILELNKIDVEDVRERQNRLAKMRSLLFRHEMKAKRVKKIKSRTYHRMLKKDKLKAASADLEADPEAAKDYAMKQEFKRAEERMTLKHKNTSQWAKRILKRGLDVQDEGTRAAIAAQLQQNALLTRKMNSVKDDSSSSDESSDDDDDDESEAKLLNKGKEKILKVLGEDNEIPQSGVFSLPFMERAMKKHEEATYEEARLALEEYDESLRKLEDDNTEENGDSMKVTGKRAFGPVKNTHEETNKRPKLHDTDKNSDSEYDSDSAQHLHNNEVNKKADGIQLGTALLDDEPENGLFKSFNDIIKNPGPKTTFEVGMLVDNSWKKVKSSKGNDNTNRSKVQIPSVADPNPKQLDHNSDSDSEEDMVEGFLTMSDTKESYELPSQADLIRQAFAGDDVEAEFEKDKMEVLNDENPEPEKPALIPGWGQWTHIQQKKGLPSWTVKEHEDAKRKREDALKRRKDAKLKHVTISEHVDKKAEKLLARNLPFPYTSKDVYEQSIQIMIREEQIIDTGVSPHVYDTGGDERAWHGHTILSQRGIEEACNQNHGEPMTRCSAIGSSVTAVSLHSGPTVQSMQAPQISQYASPMQMPECAVESSAGAPSHGPPKQHGAAVSVGDWNSNNQQVPNLANGATDKAVSGNGGCLPSQGLSANDQSTSAWDDSAPRPSKGEKERRKKNYDPDVFFKVNGKLYQKLGKIGSGGSSEVHKVISAECTIYALKKIKLRGRDYPTAYGFCQEIEYLNKLKGKSNIIQLIDYEVPVTSRISVICQQKMKLDTTCAEYLY